MPRSMIAEYLRHFDPITAKIDGASLTERCLSQLKGCFADECAYRDALKDSDPVVYSVSSLEPANGEGDLHIGLGQIMPGRVGAEYYLTRGHLHSWREAAEVYIGLSGDGLLLLESEDGDASTVTASAAPIGPNTVLYVPGHTAHRTVNTGSVPLTYLGIYPARAGHDYAAIATENFRQVVVERDGSPVTVTRTEFLASLEYPISRGKPASGSS